jgi:hypothetical protein
MYDRDPVNKVKMKSAGGGFTETYKRHYGPEVN